MVMISMIEKLKSFAPSPEERAGKATWTALLIPIQQSSSNTSLPGVLSSNNDGMASQDKNGWQKSFNSLTDSVLSSTNS